MTEAMTFSIEDARIIFRNFQGLEGAYNNAGNRNFNVVLTPELADQLLADGWNVRFLKNRDEDAEVGAPGDPVIEVTVSFKNRPPTIVVIGSKTRTQLNQDTVGVLDWMDFQTVDLFCRAYNWEVNGKTGIKAYLQTMFVVVREDPIQMKWAGVNEEVFGGS